MVHVVKLKKNKSCGLFWQGLHHCASAAKYESDEGKYVSGYLVLPSVCVEVDEV